MTSKRPTGGKIPRIIKGMCRVMGTFVTITVVSSELGPAKRALRMAFKEIHRVKDLMSVHQLESEVSQLNKKGFYDHLSTDTRYVIQRAVYFSKLSDGAFDITLLPLLEAWEGYSRKNSSPSQKELIDKLDRVGYRNIEIEGTRIKFTKKAMGLTLAGVAKGYAVDRAIETLLQNNVRNALVNGGGDIRAIGQKADGVPWRIGLLDPLKKNRLLTTIELNNRSIATSGTYQRAFNDLLNPHEGSPSRDVLSSTVITEKAMDADAMATAFLVMGPGKGPDLLDRFGEKAQILYVTREGDLVGPLNSH